jgi:hypothetical protein
MLARISADSKAGTFGLGGKRPYKGRLRKEREMGSSPTCDTPTRRR